jgi:PAS domain S-box-containing protein
MASPKIPDESSETGKVSASRASPASVSPEKTTRIQQDRYRVLIEDVADGFFEVDLHGNFKFFNDALCRIFGYAREELRDRNYSSFMDRRNGELAFQAFNRIYRTEQGVFDISWEIIRKDGETRHLEISANLILDDRGEKVGFRGIARDVTDKIIAQKALKQSEQCALELSQASSRAEQRYRAFLEFLPDPVFVFNLDSTVSYLNPAFERVFGWTLEELEGKIIPFVPEALKSETRHGIERLFREKVIHGFETQRYTKDGRLLDIIIDGAVFYDTDDQPAGQVITLRDITRQKRNERINRALFRIARALYQFRGLGARLEFITREVRDLLNIEGAMVILLDEKNKEFFFRMAAFDDTETSQKIQEVRFPVDKGVAGQVYRTGRPLIVPDTSQSPYFFQEVDRQAQMKTRSMLDVPIKIDERMIGVLCAVNKKTGAFDQEDVDLLSTIANLVALPIENASINEALNKSYNEVQSLNRAKDRVIHHLSHELKTPVSVLSASLNLLARKMEQQLDSGAQNTLERARRNLQRILDMQYQIEDMLREKDYQTYRLLSTLLDVCIDELEALVAEEVLEAGSIERIRRRIDELFGPRRAVSERIRLNDFVANAVRRLRPRFAHRTCRVVVEATETTTVWIPPEVLNKIVEGLLRNAVENTPEGGLITVRVGDGANGPEFEIKDNGVGISEENQRLIFDNYFTSYEPLHYSTRKPYDFLAGGKGFDLLRIKLFSERYHFRLEMRSKRCDYLAEDSGRCPGDIAQCPHCREGGDCHQNGGTSVRLTFQLTDRPPSKGGGGMA